MDNLRCERCNNPKEYPSERYCESCKGETSLKSEDFEFGYCIRCDRPREKSGTICKMCLAELGLEPLGGK